MACPDSDSEQPADNKKANRIAPVGLTACVVARPERFELPTPKFVAWCSIQLSYGRRNAIVMHCSVVRQRERWCNLLSHSGTGGD